MNNRYIKFIALVLSIIFVATPLMACSSANKTEDTSLTSNQITEITEMLESLISEEQTEEETTITSSSSVETIMESANDVLFSDDNDVEYSESESSSYVGNLDVFIYGLLINKLLLSYDCFSATITLDNGDCISGIGYTDYSSFFEVVDENDDNLDGYFPAGFIPLVDEPIRFCDIKDDLHGAEIRNSDYEVDNCSFFFAYDLHSFTDHCVVWGQYLKYGIDENGDIFYDSDEFDGNNFDKTVGSLYSYDEDTQIYSGPYNGGLDVTGESLSSQIDFEELNQQINDLLDQQDANFSRTEVETYFYFAQERVNAYLLAHQEESFMGYRVQDLIDYLEALEPNECIRITPNGIEINALLEEPPEEPSKLVKWLVGINAAVAVIGAIVVPLFIPALKPLCEAVAGASTEVFIEVVIQNKTLKNVNWAKVGVAAVTAVAFGFISNIKSFALGFVSSAVVGGAASAAYAYLDGKTTGEIVNAFIIGAAISGAIYTAARVFSYGVTKLVQKSKFLTSMSDKTNNFINKHQVMLFKDQSNNPTWLEKALNPRARAMAKYAALSTDEKYMKVANVKDVKYFNDQGVEITKKEAFALKDSYMVIDKTKNPEVVSVLKELKIDDKIPLNFGKPNIDDMGVCKFVMEITSDRDTNFANALVNLKDSIQSNNGTVPQSFVDEINDYLTANGKTLSSLSVSDLNNMGYTIHEGIGSVSIIKTDLHSFFGHAGGVCYAKELENFIYNYSAFNVFSGLIPETIVGTFVAA